MVLSPVMDDTETLKHLHIVHKCSKLKTCEQGHTHAYSLRKPRSTALRVLLYKF